MMSKFKKQEKGITLIALVITIIVLLILAGIAISMLSGDNSIIRKAGDATIDTNHASVWEAINVEYSSYQIDKTVGYKNTNFIDHLKDREIIKDTEEEGKYLIDLDKLSVNKNIGKGTDGQKDVYKLEVTTGETDGQKIYEVKYYGQTETENRLLGNFKENGVIANEGLKPGDTADKTEKNNYTDTSASKKQATIPAGFTISKIDKETEIDNGLVIYKIPEGKTLTDDEWNEKNGDLYTVQTKYDQYVWVPVERINDMVMCVNNNIGGHKCKIELNEDGSSISCTANGASINLCSKLYATETGENFNKDLTNQVWQDAKLSEPEVSNVYYRMEEKAYRVMALSVAKYGGFYIGRYETSNVDGVKRQIAGGTSMNGSSFTWNEMQSAQESFSTDSVRSNMVYGGQYDAMIKWIGSAGTTVNGSIKNTERTTGTKKEDKIKNIYDLYGNSFEWTMEKSDLGSYGSYRVFRGGCAFYGENSPSCRYGNPMRSTEDNGSRPTLYIRDEAIDQYYNNTVNKWSD